jgi:hypothetical protein
MVLGDLAIISKPACNMQDRAAVCTMCVSFTPAAWGAGVLKHCMERQILFRQSRQSDGCKELICYKLSCYPQEGVLC